MTTYDLTNTVEKPNGDPIEDVTVIAKLRPDNVGTKVSDGNSVTGRIETTTDASGNWTLTLEQNSNIVPAGTWWEITQKIPGVYGGETVHAVRIASSNATLAESGIVGAPAVGNPEVVTLNTGDARWGTPDERDQQIADIEADVVAAAASAAAADASADDAAASVASAVSQATAAAQALIDALVAGAPGALDTLNELAAALGDDANFSATVATSLSDLDGRLDVIEAGPTITVDDTEPSTPSLGDLWVDTSA